MIDRQSLTLPILIGFHKEHDRLPSTRELAIALGVLQPQAMQFLKNLEADGKLEKDGRFYRFKR